MDRRKLDRSRSFGTTHGPGAAYRFSQDTRIFDAQEVEILVTDPAHFAYDPKAEPTPVVGPPEHPAPAAASAILVEDRSLDDVSMAQLRVRYEEVVGKKAGVGIGWTKVGIQEKIRAAR